MARHSAGSAWPERDPFEPRNSANLAECRVSLQCLAAASEPTPTGRSAPTLALERRPSLAYRQMAEASEDLAVGFLYNRLLTKFLISECKTLTILNIGAQILTLLAYYGRLLRVNSTVKRKTLATREISSSYRRIWFTYCHNAPKP